MANAEANSSVAQPVWIVDNGSPTNRSESEENLYDESEGSDESNSDQEKKSSHGWTSLFFGARNAPRKTRGITLPRFERTRVLVVAPGAGVGANGKVYMALKHDPRLQLRVAGRSGMLYDRYPQMWPQGNPAPNLATFAHGIMSEGLVRSTDCLVCGSRGGQVVLPSLWNALGDSVPPAIVINGGCAMDLPFRHCWPGKAVTLLVLGGRDYFKPANVAPHQYLSHSQRYVPKSNSSTAILYVNEMEHMPSQQLLAAVLNNAISGLVSWQRNGQAPVGAFEMILRSVKSLGMSARLIYTSAGGWQEVGENSPLGAPAHLQSPFNTPTMNSPVRSPQTEASPNSLGAPAHLQSPFNTPTMNSPVRSPQTEASPNSLGAPAHLQSPFNTPTMSSPVRSPQTDASPNGLNAFQKARPQDGSEMARLAMAYAPLPDAPAPAHHPNQRQALVSPQPRHPPLQMHATPAAFSPLVRQPGARIMLPAGACRHIQR
eukprot:TRINITY_DN702_c0_g1_i1.p1 TRINITY_DN702_c0_g1~~TRINITY_DN702_c0_g1_i1.p1  ORF type:complete len:499 (+),score=51.66 TRINITY_DN702_c0_g1_i1:37-1497(+)